MRKWMLIFLTLALLCMTIPAAFAAEGTWICPTCGRECKRNFCTNDRTPRPAPPQTLLNLGPADAYAASEKIKIDDTNWNEYFEVSTRFVDHSLVLDDISMYSMEVVPVIQLKEEYAGRISSTKSSSVEFAAQYREYFGLYDVDFENLSFRDIHDPSVVSGAKSVNVMLSYPEEKVDLAEYDPIPGEIYRGYFMGTEPQEETFGTIAKEVGVLSAEGTIYLERG